MLKKLPTLIVATALTLFMLGSAAFVGLLAWTYTGPRSLTMLTPFIEDAFKASDGSYSAQIDDTWLQWGDWAHPLDFRLRNVRIVTQKGLIISTFPEISIDISLWMLPLGKVLPTSITVSNPVIRLFQNEDRSISLGLGETAAPPTANETAEQAPTVPFTALFGLLAGGESPLRKLQRVQVHNAKALLDNKRRGVFFEVRNVEILIRRSSKGSIRFVTSGDLYHRNQASAIGAEILLNEKTMSAQGTFLFNNLTPDTLTSLFAENPIFKLIEAPLSGKITAALTKEGIIEHIGFKLDGSNGYLNSDRLANAIPITGLHAEGTIANDAKEITLSALIINIENTRIAGNAAILLKDGDAAVQAQVSLENAVASQVSMFWPPGLSPMSREWVTTNITEGTVPNASARIRIQFGDLANPVLPKEAVDATITLRDATIHYLPEHPPATKVNGAVHIDGVSLSADITDAEYFQATKISGGRLDIEDLNADNPYIKIKLNALTTGKDAVHLLKLPRLGHAKRLNLTPDTAQGTATVQASIGFNFFAPVGADGKPLEPDVDYSVSADLKDVGAPGFLNSFDIKNSNGKFTIDNKKLTFNGSGTVNGANASQADITYTFQPKDGYDTFIETEGTAPVESLSRFGYPSIASAKGSLNVKATVKMGEEIETSSASIDLTNAAFDIETIGWKKADKEPATLQISAEKKNGVTNITSFELIGKSLEGKGTAALNKDFSIARLSLDRLLLGNTNLDHAVYEQSGNSMVLDISGKSLDLSGWLDKEDSSSNDFSFEHFPALQFKSNINKLTLSQNGSISNFKGEMKCTASRCESANISGKVGDNKEFNFRILRNPKGKRQVSLHALDAGEFLKAFGATPKLEGGDMAMTGNYEEAPTGNILRGRIVVTDFTIKKAPVLAKILSLASLTGVLDLMQGNGISFSKLSAPFTLKNDVVTFSKAKMVGGSIGITANGTMTFPKRTLNIQGTVVPAYVLNNIFGKIPLVGNLLTGGKDGGVFAFNYAVKGTEQEPDVTVNPLSILTPGFLRGIFGGGDKEEAE
jgi:hypothetical protein